MSDNPVSERLYNHLPAIYRRRDQEQGGPLRALLGILEGELQRLEDGTFGLYEDAFLETAAEWVVPYLADLLGFATLGERSFSGAPPRTQVGNAIAYREHTGTPLVLERTFHDVAGFFARVRESFECLAHTQNVLFPRPGRGGTFDVRRAAADLAAETSPFGVPSVFRTIDLSPAEEGARRIHLRNLSIALWRLLTFTLEGAETLATSAVPAPLAGATPAGFHVDPIGRDLPLFNRPEVPGDFVRHLTEGELPVRLTLAALDRDLRAFRRDNAQLDANLRPETSGFYGPEQGLDLAVDAAAIPPIDVVARSLGLWGALGVASADLAAAEALFPPFDLDRPELGITVTDPGPPAVDTPQTAVFSQLPATLLEARDLLAAGSTDVSVALLGRRLLLVPETSGSTLSVAGTATDPTTVADLLLDDAGGGGDVTGSLSGAITFPLSEPSLDVTFGGSTRTVTLADLPTDPEMARDLLEEAVRAAGAPGDAFAKARVLFDGGRLLLVPGNGASPIDVQAATGDAVTVDDLRLSTAEGGESLTGRLSGFLAPFPYDPADPAVERYLMANVTFDDGVTPVPVRVRMRTPLDLDEARVALQAALRASGSGPMIREARVFLIEEQLLVLPGPGGVSVSFASPSMAELDDEPEAGDLAVRLLLGAASTGQTVYTSGLLADSLFLRRSPRLTATVAGVSGTVTLEHLPQDLEAARRLFEAALRRAGDEDVFRRAKVAAVLTSGGQEKLFVLPGVAGPTFNFTFTNFVGDAPPSADELGLASATIEQARLSGELPTFLTLAAAPGFDATLGSEGPHRVALRRLPADLGELVAGLDCAFEVAHGSSTFRDARVARVGDQLVIIPGLPGDEVALADGGSGLLAKLGLDAPENAFGAATGTLEPLPALRRPSLLVSAGGSGRLALGLGDLPSTPETVPLLRQEALLDHAAVLLRDELRSAQDRLALRQARVLPVDEDGDGTADRLLVVSGDPEVALAFHAEGVDPTASELGLLAGVATEISVLASGELARAIAWTGAPALTVTAGSTVTVSFTPASDAPGDVAAALEAALAVAGLTDVRVAAVEDGPGEEGADELAATAVRLLLFAVGASAGQTVEVTAAPANAATLNELRLAGAPRHFPGLLSGVPTLPLTQAPAVAFSFGAGAPANAVLERLPRDLADARLLLEAALLAAGFAGAQVLRAGHRLVVLSATLGDAVVATAAPAGAANTADDSTALLLDLAWEAAVDPCRARLLLMPGAAPVSGDAPRATHTWAANGPLGGGPYDRRESLAVNAAGVDSGGGSVFDVAKGGALPTVGAALALAQASGTRAVIRILDNSLYAEDLAIDLGSVDPLRDLVIEAADGRWPTLVPATPGAKITVTGGGAESSLRLNGLLVDAEVEISDSLRLELVHATLAPRLGRPSLSFAGADADARDLAVCLVSAITGALRLPATAALVDVKTSLVDAGGIAGGAEPRPVLISGSLASPLVLTAGPEMELSFDAGAFRRVKFGQVPRCLPEAREALEAAVRAIAPGDPTFADATVTEIGGRLLLRSGGASPATVELAVSPNDVLTLSELGFSATAARELRGLFSGDLSTFIPFTLPRLRLTVGGEGPHVLELAAFPEGVDDAAALADAVARLTEALAAAVERDGLTDAPFAATTIEALSGHLLLMPAVAGERVRVADTSADPQTAVDLKLAPPEGSNVSGLLSGSIDFSRFEKPRLGVTFVEGSDEVREVTELDLPHDVDEVAALLQLALRALPAPPNPPFATNPFDSIDVVPLGTQLLVRPESEDQEITFEDLVRFDVEISSELGSVSGSVSLALPEDLVDAAPLVQAAIRALPVPAVNPFTPDNPFATVTVQQVVPPFFFFFSFFLPFFSILQRSFGRLVLSSGHPERTLVWNQGPDPASVAGDFGLTSRTRILKRGLLSAPLVDFPILSRPALAITQLGSPAVAVDATAFLAQVPTNYVDARELLEDALRRSGAVPGAEVPALTAAEVLRIGQRFFVGLGGIEFAEVSPDDPTTAELALTTAESEPLQGLLSGEITEVPSFPLPQIQLRLGNDELRTVTMPGLPITPAEAAVLLEEGINITHPVPSYLNARVALTGDGERLLIASGLTEEAVLATATEEDPTTAVDLRLESPPAILRRGVVSGDLLPFPAIFEPQLNVTIGMAGPILITLAPPLADLADIRISFENALRSVAPPVTEFLQAGVRAPRNRLLIVPPNPGDAIVIAGVDPYPETAAQLGFDMGAMLRRGLWTEPLTFPLGPPPAREVAVTISGVGPLTVSLVGDPMTVATAATALQDAIQLAGTNPPNLQRNEFAAAQVLALGGNTRLAVLAGAGSGPVLFSEGFAPADDLGLTASAGGRNGLLSGMPLTLPLTGPALNVTFGGGAANRVFLTGTLPTTVAAAGTSLSAALNAAVPTSSALALTDRLAILPPTASPGQVVTAAQATSPADPLTLSDFGFSPTGLLASQARSGLLGASATGFSLQKPQVEYRKGGGGFSTGTLTALPDSIATAASELDSALSGIRVLSFTDSGADHLLFLPTPLANQAITIQAASGDTTTAAELELTTAAGSILATGVASGALAASLTLTSATVDFTFNSVPGTATLGTTSGTLAVLAASLQAALGAAGASVWVLVLDGTNLLVVPRANGDTITFQGDAPPNAVDELLLETGGGNPGTVTQARVSGDLSPFPSLSVAPAVDVYVDGILQGTAELSPTPPGTIPPDGNLASAATALEAALDLVLGGSPDITVDVVDNRLFVVPDDPARSLELRNVGGRPTTATTLGLSFAAGASQSLVSAPLSSPLTLRAAPAVGVSINAAPAVTVTLTSVPTTLAGAVSALDAALGTAGLAAFAADASPYLFLGASNSGDSLAVSAVTVTPPGHTLPTAGELMLLPPEVQPALLSDDLTGFAGFSGVLQFGMILSGVTASVTLAAIPTDLASLATALENALQAASSDPAFTGATVEVLDDALFITPGGLAPTSTLMIEAIVSRAADYLGLLDDPDGQALVIDGFLASPFTGIVPPNVQIRVAVEGEGERILTLQAPLTLADAATNLQAAIQGAGDASKPGFLGTRLAALGTRLAVLPGLEDISIGFSDVEGQDIQLASLLKLIPVAPAETLDTLRVLESGRMIDPVPLRVTPKLDVTFGTEGPHQTFFTRSPRTFEEARALLEQALRRLTAGGMAFEDASVRFIRGGAGGGRFVVVPGVNPGEPILFVSAGDGVQMAELLKLDTSSRRAEGRLGGALGLAGVGLVMDDASTMPSSIRTASEVSLTLVTAGAPPTPNTRPLTFSLATGPMASRALLEQAIGDANPTPGTTTWDEARVLLFDDGALQRLLVVPGSAEAGADPSFTTTANDGQTADRLGLTAGAGAVAFVGLLSGDISPFPLLDPNVYDRRLEVTFDTTETVTLARVPESLEDARELLEEALAGLTAASVAFTGARVFIVGPKLLVVPGLDAVTVPAVTIEAPAGVADGANLALGLRLAAADLDETMVRVLKSGPISGLDLRSRVEFGLAASPTVAPAAFTALTLTPPRSLEGARSELETALQVMSPGTQVHLVEDERLLVLPASSDPSLVPAFQVVTAEDETTADALGLTPAAGAVRFTGLFRSRPITFPLDPQISMDLTVTLGGLTETITLAAVPGNIGQARDLLEAALRSVPLLNVPSYTGARVLTQVATMPTEERLLILPGNLGDQVVFDDSPLARALGLAPVIAFPLDPMTVPTTLSVTVAGVTQTATLAALPIDLDNAAMLLENALNITTTFFTSATVTADPVRVRLIINPGIAAGTPSFSGPLADALGLVAYGALLGGALNAFPELTVTPQVGVSLIDNSALPATSLSGTLTLRNLPADLEEARDTLERALRALVDSDPVTNRPFENIEVRAIGDRLLVLPGSGNEGQDLDFTDTALGTNTAVELGLARLNREPGHGLLSQDLADFTGIERLTPTFLITLGEEGPHQASLPGIPDTITEAADFLAEAVQAAHASFSFFDTTALPVGTDRLILTPGQEGEAIVLEDAPVGVANTLELLGLDPDDTLNPPRTVPVGSLLSGDLATFPVRVPPQVQATLDGIIHPDVTLTGVPTTLEELAACLTAALQAKPEEAFQNAEVEALADRLLVRSSVGGAALTAADITFQAAPAEAGQRILTVRRLRLDTGGGAVSADGLLSGDLRPFPMLSAVPRFQVAIGEEGPFTAELLTVPASLAEARASLEEALHRAHPSPAFQLARVATSTADGQERLLLVPGREEEILVTVHPEDDTTAHELALVGADVRLVGGLLSAPLPSSADPGAGPQLTVTMVGADAVEETGIAVLTAVGPTDLTALADDLRTALRAAGAGTAFTAALTSVVDGERLLLLPGEDGTSIAVAAPSTDTLTGLGLVVFEALGTALALGAAGPPLAIERSTVLGRVGARELTLASETLFTGPLQVCDLHRGCVRYSYLPPGSRTPRRYRSQPDLALAQALARVETISRDVLAERFGPLLAEIGAETLKGDYRPELIVREKGCETRRIEACIRPLFTSTRFGDPGYGQLTLATPREILTGAEGGSEMGVFEPRQEPRRRVLLRELLRDFLRFGLEAGLIEMQ